MPLYEYECKACHRRLEKIQKFSDPELTVCPHCGGELERTITAAAFSFQGGGWYKDGYASANAGAKPAGGESAAPAAAAETVSAPAAPATPAPAAAPAAPTTSKP